MDERKVFNSVRQFGFTLIEIVIVLVVLSILSAIAVTKFVDLRSEAVSSSVKQVSASLNSSLTFVTARINLDNAETSVEFAGDSISLTSGMPAASAATLRSLLEIEVPSSWTLDWETVPCDEPEFCILGNMYPGKSGYVEVPGYSLTSNAGLDRAAYIWPTGYTLSSTGCYSFYINEASQGEYHSGSIVEGC